MTRASLERNRRIDVLCGEFESKWNTDERSSIEILTSQVEPAERSALLAELIALEFELRTAAGERVSLAEYPHRFPRDEQAVAAAVLRISSADAFRPVVPPRDRWESTLESGRLLLGDKLGAGGMGVVFRGRDALLDRDLAVKLLPEDLRTRRQAVQRFVREAQICARLEHPGIVPVHEMGWLDERPYFTMKLVTGQSFAELLAARRLPGDELPRMLQIFGRICETMAYAHAHGVIHRDLKPANVMLGEFGEVYVIDWGLAKLLDKSSNPVVDGDVEDEVSSSPEEAAREQNPAGAAVASRRDTDRADSNSVATVFGTVVGTPQYMAPEQAAGRAAAVDRRSDVHALGAVLCEILTGAPPATGGGSAALEACSADRALVDLVHRCLANEPDDRPPDAAEVLRRVTAYQRGVENRLRETELELARRDERRRRRWVLLGLAASVMVLVSSLAAGGIWAARREAARRQEQTRQRHEQEQLRLEEARQRETVKRRLKKALFMADKLYAGGPIDWRTEPIRRTRILEQARRAETLVETGLAESADAQQVTALRGRIEADDADARLLGRLDQIRLERTDLEFHSDRLNVFRAGPMCRKAFSIYGLEIPETDAALAVKKLRGRPARVAEACVFPLECWRMLLPAGAPETAWIDMVLDQIDDNDWRRKVREACRDSDWPEVDRLLEMARRKRLAADTVNLIAMWLIREDQFELADKLLRPAQVQHPGDFWINHYLGIALSRLPVPEFEESLRYYTAALAIRESAEAYQNLAASLLELRRYSEAEHALRSAARLQPDWALPHVELSRLLGEQRRLEEALRHARLAVAAAPELSDAALIHGQLLLDQGRRAEGLRELQRVLQLDPGNEQAQEALEKESRLPPTPGPRPPTPDPRPPTPGL